MAQFCRRLTILRKRERFHHDRVNHLRLKLSAPAKPAETRAPLQATIQAPFVQQRDFPRTPLPSRFESTSVSDGRPLGAWIWIVVVLVAVIVVVLVLKNA